MNSSNNLFPKIVCSLLVFEKSQELSLLFKMFYMILFFFFFFFLGGGGGLYFFPQNGLANFGP